MKPTLRCVKLQHQHTNNDNRCTFIYKHPPSFRSVSDGGAGTLSELVPSSPGGSSPRLNACSSRRINDEWHAT